MKRNFLLSCAAAFAAAFVGANTIDWSVDDVVLDTEKFSATAPDTYAFALLSSTDNSLVAASDSDFATEVEDGKITGFGTWSTDSLADGATYLVALYDATAETPSYYLLNVDGEDLTVTYDSMSFLNGNNPLLDSTEVSGTVSVNTTAVPEPATAALALVGVAMMFKRRK